MRIRSLLPLLLAGSLLGGSCQVPQGSATMPSTQSFDAAPRSVPRVPVSMSVTGPLEGQRTFGAPYQLPGQSSWLSSFTITKKQSLFRDPNPFAEGGLGNQQRHYDDEGAAGWQRLRSAPILWHNGALSDRASGDEWLLLERRGFLSFWWMLLDAPEDRPEGAQARCTAMIFAATLEDSNGDGTLDNRDASVALLTDGDGRHPRIVTPPGAQLATVQYYPGEDALAFGLRLDRDGDGEFDREDPLRLYSLRLDGDAAQAQPWHGHRLMQALEGLY